MVKYVVISGPYFPVFGLNTENYRVDFLIQSEYRKIRTRNYLRIWTIFTQWFLVKKDLLTRISLSSNSLNQKVCFIKLLWFGYAQVLTILTLFIFIRGRFRKKILKLWQHPKNICFIVLDMILYSSSLDIASVARITATIFETYNNQGKIVAQNSCCQCLFCFTWLHLWRK